MLFIADAMLGRLAKRLRLLGIDVLYSPAFTDNEILRLALEQSRVILTRDTGLASRPLARNHLLIESEYVDEQIAQVRSAFVLHGAGTLNRCSRCNGLLTPLDRRSAQDQVPAHVHVTIREFYLCSGCGKVYWRGSHAKHWENRNRQK